MKRKWQAREIYKPEQKVVNNFWSGVDKTGNCWVWRRYIDPLGGYGVACVGSKTFLAHRLSYAIAHGYCPPDKMICHTCDNPPCVNPNHLFLGDHEINMRDMVLKGRNSRGHGDRYRGEKHHDARLTDNKVMEIIWLRSQGMLIDELGRRYGVSEGNISAILCGKLWKHITSRIIQKRKRSGNAILTDQEVMEIIWLRSKGANVEELGHRYRVVKSTISAILCGKRWKHITRRLIPTRMAA